jgi:Flp pilus assembly protein TadD
MAMRDQLLGAAEAALQRGEWAAAVDHCRSALALSPGRDGAAQAMLGMALLQLGQHVDAITALEQAAGMDKRNPHWLAHLAQAYTAAHRLDEAHRSYQRASRLVPRHWPYTQNAALILIQQGKTAEAETVLRALARRHPGEPDIQLNLGNVLLELGRPAEAEAVLRDALKIAPEDAQILQSLGSAQHRQSRFEEACASYRACMHLEPRAPAPRLNLVSALIDDGRNAEAETECLALLEFAPTLPDAHRFLAAALGFRGDTAGALRAFSRAAELAPDSASDIRNFGGALAECGQLQASLRQLARAEQLAPDDSAVRQLRSAIDLAQGRLGDGWHYYRGRQAFVDIEAARPELQLQQTLPEDVRGCRITLWPEQGIGDELFFLRHADQLRNRGAIVSVRASAKIAAFVARSAIADDVVIHDAAMPVAEGLQMLCGDLPGALSATDTCPCPGLPTTPVHTLSDYAAWIRVYWPQPAPPLRIPPLDDALARARAILQAAGPAPHIGITWRGGIAARQQRGSHWVLEKSVPLAELGAALRGVPGTLLSLQRQPLPEETAALSATVGRKVIDLSALNEDLETLLALLALIDDYVGVSNTNMHLRAACDRPARVLVPNPAEWRWMQGGGESPWFPGFRIYRQTLDGRWGPALTQLAADLATSQHRVS